MSDSFVPEPSHAKNSEGIAQPLTQHTPGPWSLRHSRNGSGDIGIAAPGVGNVIAECFAAMRHHDERSPEVEANARLMSAAPDLLRACADWIRWLDADEWRDDAADYEREMLNAMRTAIRKATDGRDRDRVADAEDLGTGRLGHK